MKARLLLDEKSAFADGSILAVRIWAVPKPVPPATLLADFHAEVEMVRGAAI